MLGSRRLFRIGLSLGSLCLILLAGPLSAQDPTLKPSNDPQNTVTTEASTAQNGTLNVMIEGLDDNPELRDNVLAFLDINRFAGKPAPEEVRLNWLHDNAKDEIRQALQPFGYFEPAIDASLTRTDSGWTARYRIQPGRPIRITELDVQVLGEGAKDPAFQDLLANLPLEQGQVLDQPEYEQIKNAMESLATERGYFNARFAERAIRVNLEDYTTTVRLHYDTGQRYEFGNITFKQDFLSPDLLARYPKFESGDPYNVNQLLKLQTDLGNSPYFSRVEVNAEPADGTTTSPVTVELEPNKQNSYSVGLGYGTDTGFRFKLGTEKRWVNRRGHHYEAELGYSQIKSLIGFKYMIPGEDPTTDEYSITTGYVRQNDDDKEYETYTIGGGYQEQDGKWTKLYSLNLQYEEFTIGNRPSKEESLLLIPGLNWTWVDADDRTYPTNGLLFGFELRGATTALLSDTNFLQGKVRGEWIYALNDKNRLLARGDLGTTIVDDFEKLPTSLRFFTGGDASVRGYGYESIGPTDPDGTVVGGKNLIVASLEYEYWAWGNWGVAAFVDTGDAFDDVEAELKTGVGVGVRWRSPVGPMRLDFASGLDRPPGDAFRFSFSIGPDL